METGICMILKESTMEQLRERERTWEREGVSRKSRWPEARREENREVGKWAEEPLLAGGEGWVASFITVVGGLSCGFTLRLSPSLTLVGLGATSYLLWIHSTKDSNFNYLLRTHMEHDAATPLHSCHDILSLFFNPKVSCQKGIRNRE